MDVITKVEPVLFKKVTGIEVADFDKLVHIGVFNSAAMNEAVAAFRRYVLINIMAGKSVCGTFLLNTKNSQRWYKEKSWQDQEKRAVILMRSCRQK